MKMKTDKTAQLGDLIADAFDEAARHSTDPREVSRLATEAVMLLARRARRLSVRPPPTAGIEATYTWE